MFPIFDNLWIENRGMSIISATFFTGVFLSMAAIIWWSQKETKRLEKIIERSIIQDDATKKELNKINIDLAVIRSTTNKMDKSLDHLIEKFY